MMVPLLAAALAAALLDWFAVARQWKGLEYLAKPAVMVFLLVWLYTVSGYSGALLWFALGLAFSLAGDIFLMLPKEQFIAGLVSFLLAHLVYLVGFNTTPPPLNAASVLLAVLIGFSGLRIYRSIAAGLKRSGHTKLQIPVLVYSIAISLMLLSAMLTLVRPDQAWQAGPATLVSAGALLFFISDSTLAWNKFVAPLPNGKLVVIITYHLGQILITAGAALHFMPAG